jgi:aldehyde dehydrogenase (NAD+)
MNGIDAYLTNLCTLTTEIKHTIANLKEWSSAEARKTPLSVYPGKSYVKPQARGVVLVLGSWNYPLGTMQPMINAIAAGNCVILKPSEVAPASSALFKKICSEFLDTRFYRCIEGGIATSDKLCSLPLDLICFTGSTHVGKIIAKIASANLIPCILELGGKCTTIVDHTANIDLAAKRIASNKFLNCG